MMIIVVVIMIIIMNVYIYIYIYRERERDIGPGLSSIQHVCIDAWIKKSKPTIMIMINNNNSHSGIYYNIEALCV